MRYALFFHALKAVFGGDFAQGENVPNSNLISRCGAFGRALRARLGEEMPGNSNLHDSSRNKQDEFYTNLVVTNPPFSLFSEYVAQLKKHQGKD